METGTIADQIELILFKIAIARLETWVRSTSEVSVICFKFLAEETIGGKCVVLSSFKICSVMTDDTRQTWLELTQDFLSIPVALSLFFGDITLEVYLRMTYMMVHGLKYIFQTTVLQHQGLVVRILKQVAGHSTG